MRTPSLDPFGSESLADPYPLYERLRAAGPVVHIGERDLWAVSTYDAVRDVLRRPDEFSSGNGAGYTRVEASGMRGPLIDNDPPVHTRVRRSVQRWFTPSAIEARREAVRERVEQLVDRALADGVVDGVRAIAAPLPVLVMQDLLGLEHPDPLTVAGWMDAMFHLLGPDPRPEHETRAHELFGWLLTTVSTLPEGSLGRAIAYGSGDPAENLGLLASIWVAGIDTSANLISTALQTLATVADASDPAVDPAALTEECLRFRSPVRAFMRRTTTETNLFGTELPADADVCVLYASANRDPLHYADPDRFDAHRNPVDHLAFGSGIHLCLGAPLLRLEARELFDCLRTRHVRITPAGDPVPNLNPMIQGYLELPLHITTGEGRNRE